MVTLAIEGSGGSELTYHLSKDSITIGASSQNDVVIRSPGVAPRHLLVQWDGKVFTFVGQNRQFVVLNGERRSRGVLRVGDKIRIGSATVIFKGLGESQVEDEVIREAEKPKKGEALPAPKAEVVSRGRSEVVLYSEPNHLSEARHQLVELFRGGAGPDLVSGLRTFLESFYGDRQAMLAVLDGAGRFEPVASRWTGELPRLPPRTFEELSAPGRYAVVHMGARRLLIYPVGRGPIGSPAFLVSETSSEERDDDLQLMGEMAAMLAVHWEQIEHSNSLHGQWESRARKQLELHFPGSSHATQVLKDAVVGAARSPYPALFCGRPGTGRMWTASLIASLHPGGPLTVTAFQGREGDEAVLRQELLGSGGEESSDAGLQSRARGGVLVVRDIHVLPLGLQREIAAAIRQDLARSYGPSLRWMATTREDSLALVNEGALDAALFSLFQHHLTGVPSLGERREDLPLIIVRLLDFVAAEQEKEVRGIELETLNSLLLHSFPEQMTELLGELRRLVSATPSGDMVRGTVPVGDAAEAGSPTGEPVARDAAALLSIDDLKVVITGVERLIIDRVLRNTKGNQSKAARTLNLSRGALISKIKEYEIPDYRYLRRRR